MIQERVRPATAPRGRKVIRAPPAPKVLLARLGQREVQDRARQKIVSRDRLDRLGLLARRDRLAQKVALVHARQAIVRKASQDLRDRPGRLAPEAVQGRTAKMVSLGLLDRLAHALLVNARAAVTAAAHRLT